MLPVVLQLPHSEVKNDPRTMQNKDMLFLNIIKLYLLSEKLILFVEFVPDTFQDILQPDPAFIFSDCF